jgi:hypothetical protein
MSKSKFVLMSIGGCIIPQNLELDEAGPVICTMIQNRAIVLPFICIAENSQEALSLYQEKIKDNIEIFELFLAKETFYVR